jgi:hypothetical protein
VKKLFSWMVFAVAAIYGASYLLHRFPVTTEASSTQALSTQTSSAEQGEAKAADPKPPEAADAAKAVTMVGPLADYMQGEKSSSSSENAKAGVPWTPHAGDLVVDSPTGTGGAILHKTFAVATTVKFLFEIPAHATNPQLRGNYRSFLKPGGDASADGDANVEFLLMNSQQYADFARGHQADVLYFVESSHSQQVNLGLSPTYNKPAQYCLVFRNRSGDAGKKIVQADFSVDF